MEQKELFFLRQSKRAFTDAPVPREMIEKIFERVRWSPSCFNHQPWRFLVADEPEALQKVHEGLVKANAWAKKAPVMVVVLSHPDYDYKRKDEPFGYYLFDCGLAVENLLLAAVQEGLMGHPMAGYKADKVKQNMNIPDDMQVVCLIALGYPGQTEQLDPETRAKDEKPRERKPMSEFLFFNNFPG
jgi:nitroreductase